MQFPILIADAIDSIGQTIIGKISSYGPWIAVIVVFGIGLAYVAGRSRGHEFSLGEKILGIVLILGCVSLATSYFGGVH